MMNYSFEYIDIILLAMIAGFIFLRLRGIMGKRTGFEGKVPPQFQEILKNRNIFKTLKNLILYQKTCKKYTFINSVYTIYWLISYNSYHFRI